MGWLWNLSSRILALSAGLLLSGSAAMAAVTTGSIAFIGMNADDAEHFAFVVVNPISSGETINFTDSSYGSNGVNEGDKFRWTEHFSATIPGPLAWTTTSNLSAGTVVIWNDTNARFELTDGNQTGTVVGGSMDFGASGEGLFAYQGTVTDAGGTAPYRGITSGVNFIGAINLSSAWLTTGAGSTSTNYLPSSLTNGTSAFDYASTLDNYRYNGPRSFASSVVMLAALEDSANWTGSDSVVAATSDFGGNFVISAIPEPSAFAALAGVLALGCVATRRRRSA